MSRVATQQPTFVLDYPTKGEVVTSKQYTLRFGASEETRAIEVSIDGGPWQQCRESAGYFWFDWSNYLSGRHEIAARAMLADGSYDDSVERRVRVELANDPN